MRASRWFSIFIGVHAVLFGVSRPIHAEFIFTRIIDSTTALPGGNGNRYTFDAPSLRAGNFAFGVTEQPFAGTSGIYTLIGGQLRLVANGGTTIPRSPLTYNRLFAPSFDGQTVAFIGGNVVGTTFLENGLYASRDGVLTTLADLNTPLPGTSGNLDRFDSTTISIDQGRVAFGARANVVERGLYLAEGGTITMLANQDTARPDGQHLAGYVGPALDGDAVAFQTTINRGIYRLDASEIAVIADTDTIVPDGSRTFTFNGPSHVALDGSDVAFYGNGADQDGIYADFSAGLFRIADTNMLMPGLGEEFRFFEGLALEDGSVALSGRGSGGSAGIYLWQDDRLTKIIDTHDLLDGLEISSLWMGREGLNNGTLAFAVDFRDGSSAIYTTRLTAVPEPSSIVLMGVGLAALIAITARRDLQRRMKNAWRANQR